MAPFLRNTYVTLIPIGYISADSTPAQYDLLKRWADYLVQGALSPKGQCVIFTLTTLAAETDNF